MLKQAEERERQEIRIQERKLQRELEQELKQDPSLKDTMETFVTEAYRKQQELIKQMEEEERRRDAEEAARATTKDGFTGFYKNLLDTRASTAENAREKLKDMKKSGHEAVAAVESKDTAAKQVDYSQPPSGGLNIFKRPKTIKERLEEAGKSAAEPYRRESWREQQHKRDQLDRDRLSRQFAAQLAEREQEEAKKRQEEEEALKRKYQRQTDDDAVAEARRRFEERRRQRQQQSSSQSSQADP